jgi:hypothetical protein
MKSAATVLFLAVVFAVLWWFLTLLKVTFDLVPLSWFEQVASAKDTSEALRILGVRLLWVLDFVLPVLLAALAVSGLTVAFFRKLSVHLLIFSGALAFAGLFWLLARMEPAYVPDWVSFPVMAASFLGLPVATRAMILRFTQRQPA